MAGISMWPLGATSSSLWRDDRTMPSSSGSSPGSTPTSRGAGGSGGAGAGSVVAVSTTVGSGTEAGMLGGTHSVVDGDTLLAGAAAGGSAPGPAQDAPRIAARARTSPVRRAPTTEDYA